jgi:hypothetical protein
VLPFTIRLCRHLNKRNARLRNVADNKPKKKAGRNRAHLLHPEDIKNGDRVKLKFKDVQAYEFVLQIGRTYKDPVTGDWRMDGTNVTLEASFTDLPCALYSSEAVIRFGEHTASTKQEDKAERKTPTKPAVETAPVNDTGTFPTAVLPPTDMNAYVEGGRHRQAPNIPAKKPKPTSTKQKPSSKKRKKRPTGPAKSEWTTPPTKKGLKSLTMKQSSIMNFVEKQKSTKKVIMKRLQSGEMFWYRWKEEGWLRGDFVRICNGRKDEKYSHINKGILLCQSYFSVELKVAHLDHLNIKALPDAEGSTDFHGWHFENDKPDFNAADGNQLPFTSKQPAA